MIPEELAEEVHRLIVEDGQARVTFSEYAPYFRTTEAQFKERWEGFFLNKVWDSGFVCGRPSLDFHDGWETFPEGKPGDIRSSYPYGTFRAAVVELSP